MGKWNRRYYPRSNRRGRYQDYDWSPPRETYRDPELGVWQDNVPMWEKKFCFLSGVPWEKVLSASKFMHCQTNIVEWDDTAGKEAFHSAKESYRAKLNGGGQSEIRAPDPDAYIGEIDWNPYIDPELIKDLDRNFFVPDDNTYNSSEPFKDPWDRDHSHSSEALKNKAAVGLDNWDQSVDTHEEPAENNPWDSATTKLHEKDKATVWNQWDASVDAIDNPWERGHASEMLKNKSAEKQSNRGNSWGYHDRNGTAANNYGSQNWRQRSYSNNGNNNYGSSYHHGGGSNDRRNNWGQNQCGGQYGGQRRGFVEDRGRKREGPGQNMTGYKGPKLHYTDESSRRWKNGGDENGYVSKFNSFHN